MAKASTRVWIVMTAVVLVIGLARWVGAAPASAWSDGASASLVLGQASFTSRVRATSQAGMDSLLNLAIDPTTGAVFVVDWFNNRVLRFSGLESLSNGVPASGVLGQASFTSRTAAASQSTMDGPQAAAVDSAGRLWVADTNNNRVLRFDNAANLANGAPADGVLGQANFTGNMGDVSQVGMIAPQGVAVDSAGRLWVVDSNNNRVLRFDGAASKVNGAPADGVLGQAIFTTFSDGLSATRMSSPRNLAVDGAGRLWVTDSLNIRVLRFDNAASKPNGAAADGVLGQPDFVSNIVDTSATGMMIPTGVAVASTGRVWVADAGINRVLRFDNAASKPNGAAADGVLGQPGYYLTSSATTAVGMYSPMGAAVDGAGRLWVADQGNNRVLVFQESVALSGITRLMDSPTQSGALTFEVRFDGPVSGLSTTNFSLTASGVSGASITRVDAVSASTYTVTVSSGTGAGTLRLDLANATGLTPTAVLPGLPYTAGEAYTFTYAARPASAWSDGASASLELGQANFTSRVSATSQAGMVSPLNLAIDPTTGAVFVVDWYNNRVLRYASLAGLSNGAPASGVLGQSSFTSSTAAASQSAMNGPQAAAVDSAGRLWVADTNNNRVLRFDNAANLANGAPADGVLGQANFTGNMGAAGQVGMSTPVGVVVDSAGRLWVADSTNNRVLRFDNAASKVNGAPADGVLGQANFSTYSDGLSATGMSSPKYLAVDGAGRLWVIDFWNIRVLRFDNAANLANGAPAVGVLGQPDFVTSNPGIFETDMLSPTGVAVDSTGRAWVVDGGKNRVLRFDNAASKANGAGADGVLGQATFSGSSFGTSQAELYSPTGVAVDGAGRLWVADFSNNRVLVFQDGVILNGITRAASSPTNAASVTFSVVLSGPVSGLSSANFSLSASGLSGASITQVDAISASAYTVTVSSGTGEGTLRLVLDNMTGLTPVVSLPALPDASGEAYAVDRAAPAAPVVSAPAAGGSVNTARPAFEGTGEVGAAVVVKEGTLTLCSTTVGSDGKWSCTAAADLSEAAHSVTVTQTDAIGNPSPAAARSFSIDLTAPDAPVVSAPADGASLNIARPVFSGTGEVGAAVTVKEGTGSVCGGTVGSDGKWTCTPAADLAEGTRNLAVIQTDPAGNPSTAAALSITIDLTVPNPPVVSAPADGSTVRTVRPTFAGTGEAGAAVTVKEGTLTLCSAAVGSDGKWTCTPAADLSEGAHNLTIFQTDAAGNDSSTAAVSMTIQTQYRILFILMVYNAPSLDFNP